MEMECLTTSKGLFCYSQLWMRKSSEPLLRHVSWYGKNLLRAIHIHTEMVKQILRLKHEDNNPMWDLRLLSFYAPWNSSVQGASLFQQGEMLACYWCKGPVVLCLQPIKKDIWIKRIYHSFRYDIIILSHSMDIILQMCDLCDVLNTILASVAQAAKINIRQLARMPGLQELPARHSQLHEVLVGTLQGKCLEKR